MKEQLISLAKLVEELGFKPKTATTIVIHRCFLGGKSVTINDTCIYLWMCEIQKWLREIHDIEVYVRSTRDFKEKKHYIAFIAERNGCLETYHKTYEKALEIGLYQALLLLQ